MSLPLERERIAVVKNYFQKIDKGDQSFLDTFHDNFEFHFPKFGTGRGKKAWKTFSSRAGLWLESLGHHIDNFRYLIAGNDIVVEGREYGVTRSGISWPDNDISEGRFCSIFTFEGKLITRMYIYVDPDFTSADAERIGIFYGEHNTWVSNKQLVRSFITYLEHSDIENALDLLSNNATWWLAGKPHLFPDAGTKNKSEVSEAFATLFNNFSTGLKLNIEGITAENDRVAVEIRSHGITREGKVYENDYHMLFNVSDGKIQSVKEYTDPMHIAETFS